MLRFLVMNPFDGCRQRIGRANFHGNALAELWNSFNTNDAYATRINLQDDGTGEVFVSPTELDWRSPFSLQFGELLYQLRAALDSLIYQSAVLQSGKNPPPKESNLQFPISSCAENFKSVGHYIAPLSDECKAFIESVQPYQANVVTSTAPDGNGSRWNINNHIATLNDLARKDRHRRLRVAGCSAVDGVIQIGLPVGSGMSVEYASFQSFDTLENESKLGTFKIANFWRHPNVQVNTNLTFHVAIEDIPLTSVDAALSFETHIRGMTVSVGAIVMWFERYFGLEQ
jgi:hypothetical protein